MLSLTADEQARLDEYRNALMRRYPGVVRRMIVCGSKARGDSHVDSDIDIMIVVRNDAAHLQLPLRELGHDLATFRTAMPSMFVYTEEKWRYGVKIGFPYHRNVEREGIDVYEAEDQADEGERDSAGSSAHGMAAGARSTARIERTARFERLERVIVEVVLICVVLPHAVDFGSETSERHADRNLVQAFSLVRDLFPRAVQLVSKAPERRADRNQDCGAGSDDCPGCGAHDR